VGVVQAACLLIVTVFTLVYTVFKDRITTKKLRGLPVLILVGLLLGIMSSFLGIGGGPINLVVLFYLFSMTTKEAVITSLYIIFISQIASLATAIITNTVPEFPVKVLVVMAAGGILGGVVGRIVNKKIADKTVDKLFIGLMAGVIVINIYNIFSSNESKVIIFHKVTICEQTFVKRILIRVYKYFLFPFILIIYISCRFFH